MRTKRADGKRAGDLEWTVAVALRTAHLLTASLQQAERAVSKAIDGFDPEVDTADTLFRNTIRAAVQSPPVQSQATEPVGPVELHAVLGLPENLRRCFVLRVLAGLPRAACARLLNLNAASVNENTCAALERLAGLNLAGCGPQ
ncbi:MAG TPA: sigma factor-like helix-turn-helix DNA-binding protein [Bryobacteraceae bacterium]|nr:sigma factor-like helix-turn-helix DNA-binding protein [Bryobacteraceae bacterium]